MKPILSLCLLLASASGVFGQTPGNTPNAKNSIDQTLLQLERDWSRADREKDVDALNRILGEDWIGIDFEGTVLNKRQALAGMSSDSGSLDSTELSDMKVRVYGNMAIVTGIDTEKGEYHGKDSSGKYVWTDVFALRNGRWQAVSSQSTKLTRAEGTKDLAQLLVSQRRP